MPWSTRQLAELAGTTVNTVRHYHRIGLLDEPDRAVNGYKQYGSAHLVRLLQIRRMRGLGVPLGRIDAMGRAAHDRDEAVRALEAELAETIARQQRIRAELALLREHGAPLDVPPPFGPVADELNERDHALVTVYSQVFDDDHLDDLRQLVAERDPDEDDEFDDLPEDADDATIEALAARMAVAMRGHLERFAWMGDAAAASPRGAEYAKAVIVPAVADLYNRAQLKALARAHSLMHAGPGAGPDS